MTGQGARALRHDTYTLHPIPQPIPRTLRHAQFEAVAGHRRWLHPCCCQKQCHSDSAATGGRASRARASQSYCWDRLPRSLKTCCQRGQAGKGVIRTKIGGNSCLRALFFLIQNFRGYRCKDNQGSQSGSSGCCPIPCCVPLNRLEHRLRIDVKARNPWLQPFNRRVVHPASGSDGRGL